MHAITVAIDLAKDVFELAFADERGRVVERKRLSRRTLARTSIASLGAQGEGHPRPQQGRLRVGQQTGATAVGDGTPRPGLRSATRESAAHCTLIFNRSIASTLQHQQLPKTISIMVKGSVPARTKPITIQAAKPLER